MFLSRLLRALVIWTLQAFFYWVVLIGPILFLIYAKGTGNFPVFVNFWTSQYAYLTLIPGGILLIKKIITGKFI